MTTELYKDYVAFSTYIFLYACRKIIIMMKMAVWISILQKCTSRSLLHVLKFLFVWESIILKSIGLCDNENTYFLIMKTNFDDITVS